MPIRELEQLPPRLAAVVRIRGGVYLEDQHRPDQTSGLVFTSSHRGTLEQLRLDYAGTLEQYVPQGSTQEVWRLVTEADTILAQFPFAEPDQVFEQHYELWSRSGILRRCDGEFLYGGVDPATGEVLDGQSCRCSPDERQCAPHTRLKLWLPQIVGVGVAEVVTTSKWSMRGIHDQIQVLYEVLGHDLSSAPVELRYWPQRITWREGEKRKTATKRIYSIDLAMSVGELMAMNRDRLAIATTLLRRSGRELPPWMVAALPPAEQQSLPAPAVGLDAAESGAAAGHGEPERAAPEDLSAEDEDTGMPEAPPSAALPAGAVMRTPATGVAGADDTPTNLVGDAGSSPAPRSVGLLEPHAFVGDGDLFCIYAGCTLPADHAIHNRAKAQKGAA